MGKSNRLTAASVKQAKTPGVLRDGDGLLLRVEPTGGKRWVLRTTVKGKRRDIGLGSANVVSLAEAREAAHELRKHARAGRDPADERRRAKGPPVTFKDAARQVHAARKDGWSNGKHTDQWINTLAAYAYPVIGSKLVGDVEAADVLRVLIPIWLKKPETARRVRQRIGIVLDWSVTAGHRPSNLVNAAHAVRAGLPRQPKRGDHHAAVPWPEVPALMSRIREAPSIKSVRWALEFLVLTAARTGEVLGAVWTEFDFDGATWTIPPERMKAGREHRVPLSPAAVAIIKQAQALWPEADYVFAGRGGIGPLSNMAMAMLMRRLGRTEVPHGFRSSFRDWAADNRWDRDLAEAALAHALPSKTEAAYRRSDLFEARREMMVAWADWLTSNGKERSNSLGALHG